MNLAKPAERILEADSGVPHRLGPEIVGPRDPALLLAIELATFGESLRALRRPGPARGWLDASRRRVLARFDARAAG